MLKPGKSYLRERLSTVDLLVLAGLDKLLFKLEILFLSPTKQATLIRRSTVLSLSRQLAFLAQALAEVNEPISSDLTLANKSLGATTLSLTPLSVMTLGKTTLYNETQNNNIRYYWLKC